MEEAVERGIRESSIIEVLNYLDKESFGGGFRSGGNTEEEL